MGGGDAGVGVKLERSGVILLRPKGKNLPTEPLPLPMIVWWETRSFSFGHAPGEGGGRTVV